MKNGKVQFGGGREITWEAFKLVHTELFAILRCDHDKISNFVLTLTLFPSYTCTHALSYLLNTSQTLIGKTETSSLGLQAGITEVTQC